MNKHDIDKAYISPIDKFLFKFDQEHKKSASQIKEIQKYRRIAMYRDDPFPPGNPEEIWGEF